MDGSFPIALSVTIRLCRREDLDDLEWFGQRREHRPLLEQAFAAQGRGEQAFLVAEANGFPVGQLWVDLAKLRAESIGMLWALRVLEPLQNLGIGTRLIAAAEWLLTARGFAMAEIGVEKDNPRARRLYERLGYCVVAENLEAYERVTPDARTVREVIDEWIMRKNLSNRKENEPCSGSN